jgi:diphthamide biosynthesis protein 2
MTSATTTTTTTSEQTQAPVLSTPETNLFEDPTPIISHSSQRYTEEELWDVYEIARTARELREGGHRRVALQFPDQMLRDAPRVVERLETEVGRLSVNAKVKKPTEGEGEVVGGEAIETGFNGLAIDSQLKHADNQDRVRFYILADTSYGSCCVDEIAAEHANADVVVHYGRSCLSPTARLPVIYVFTSHLLDISSVVKSFEATFSSKEEKVLLMADITYQAHIPVLVKTLLEKGYGSVVAPEVVHDPSSVVPNRRVEEGVKGELGSYSLFHISDPPPALLLTLSSRVRAMFVYPTSSSSSSISTEVALTPEAQSARLLRRRYALLTSLTTCPIFGILINTLSVKNYLSTVSSLQSLISRSGKKYYTFVVGKVNAAKIANFSEIGGWVVVGCWESSFVESGSGEFYRPLITPFELGLCLMGDEERVWDGSWVGDFASVKSLTPASSDGSKVAATKPLERTGEDRGQDRQSEDVSHDDSDSEPESAPPEFDLRTGRYVSHSRPMALSQPRSSSSAVKTSDPNLSSPSSDPATGASDKLIRRAIGELATINGAVSPGAEYLRTQRTWTGLGSDFVDADVSDSIEEGRSGVARGYVVGEGGERH